MWELDEELRRREELLAQLDPLWSGARLASLSPEEEGELMRLFDAIDKDCDGAITREEVRGIHGGEADAVFHRLEVNPSPSGTHAHALWPHPCSRTLASSPSIGACVPHPSVHVFLLHAS